MDQLDQPNNGLRLRYYVWFALWRFHPENMPPTFVDELNLGIKLFRNFHKMSDADFILLTDDADD